MKYRADIDGLRAVAVLSVMAYHLNPRWLPGGFIGVDIFFAISGLVVCASLAASQQHDVLGYISTFYARRLARIVPALVVVLLVTSMLATLFIPHAWLSTLDGTTARYAYFGLSNWVLAHNTDTYFAPRAELNPYTHTWSLGVEEQFYVVFPIMCLFWVRATFNRNRRQTFHAIVALVFLSVVSLVASRWATREQPTQAFYSIAFRFWELAAGAVLFQASSGGRSSPTKDLRLQMFGPWLGAAALIAGGIFADSRYFPFPWAIVAVLGTLLVMGGAGSSTSHPVRQWLAHAIPVWIGKRSYSLYLWHWPVYVLMRWTVGLAGVTTKVFAVVLTALLASASYRLIEVPLRHGRVQERFRPALQIASFLMLVLIGWRVTDGVVWRGGLSVVARNSADWYVTEGMPRSSEEEETHRCRVAVTSRSLADGSVTERRPIDCSGVTTVPGTLIVFGDSHAGAFTPMFERLAAETGLEIHIYFKPGCGYLNLLAPMVGGQTSDCLEFWRLASLEVLARPVSVAVPSILFLPSLRQHLLVEQSDVIDIKDVESAMLGPESRALREQAAREAAEWLKPFLGNHINVLFEAPLPIFRSPPFRCSDWFNRSNPICRGGFTQPKAYLERLRDPVVSTMRSLTTEPALGIWDPFPVLCPTDTCSAFDGGRPLFFDGDHISAYGNLRLYQSFKSDMLTHLKRAATQDPRWTSKIGH